ncbi:DUF6261 family protein [Epilithonimonas mollis]|uniref:Uncharacterized protein n=1 Tax=Epilithonimonas mollis TaxID=216903 RepID=A0A1M6U3L8_9FLAO|nr:DUF6261 family protein [Epilithonimonas mollis]SHK63753.1 hypothetical protein SAMN05444371_3102 [Epilithonimonas mollis]
MKIALSRLSTKDLATLSQRIINTSEPGKYPVIDNHPLLTALKTKYADYDAVYTKMTFSGMGNDVATSDRERDLSFSTVKIFLNGYRKMSTLPNFQSAEELYQIFSQYGLDLDRLSYSSQTAQMKKLIEELEKPENTAKITALSLKDAFTDMKTKQTAFEEIFAVQAGANADLRNQKTASAIRKDLEKSLKALLGLITVMKDVADWKLFYAEINELVKAAKNSNLPDNPGNDNPPQ